MAKRMQTPEDLDQNDVDVEEDEDMDTSKGRFHGEDDDDEMKSENLDDEDTDKGTRGARLMQGQQSQGNQAGTQSGGDKSRQTNPKKK